MLREKCLTGNKLKLFTEKVKFAKKVRQVSENSFLNFYTNYLALNIFQTEFGSSHPEIAECYNSLAILYKNIGKHEDAIECIEKGVKILQAVRASSRLKKN